MATRFDDPEIDLARQRLRSFAEKSESLRQSGGSLDANGEPSLTSERGGGQNPFKAARMNMMGGAGGKPINATPGFGPPGSDNYITGTVGGKEKRRPAQTTWGEEKGPQKKQEAMLRPTKLSLPAVRARRPANEDGATSFHFSHEAISKTNQETTTSRGTKNRKGAAKDHAKYIERDEAVTRAEADGLDKIEKELDEIARNDPELAQRLGLENDRLNGAGDGKEDETDRQAVAKALGVGALAGVYIEREEALAHNDNGVAVLFTNISKDPKERRDFWKHVEDHESNPSADKMTILMKGNEEFWKKVAEDKECPKVLRQSIEAADPREEVIVRTGDNEAVRQLMMKHGWRPREKRPEGETDEQRAEREEREAQTSFGARFEDGRGGRVQFRVVGELPFDVDPEARVRILKGFADEFEKRGLPYIAVMHSPDHTNDDRNWHFHLVYHDRPVRRFTGRAEDHLWELPDDASKQVADRHAVARAALDSNLSKHVGKWDFIVPFDYETKCRHARRSYPFAQPKDREANKRTFIPMLRRRLAELTNNELAVAGKDRRLDPRKYSEMGIHKAPDVHLGTQASRLEALGVPTEPGIRNEQNQWEYIQDNLRNQKARTDQKIDRQLSEWRKSLDASDVTAEKREAAEKAMIRWEQSARRASEHRAIALNLQEHYDRLRSRAAKLEKMAKKHIDAIKEQRATRRQSQNLSRYEAKLAEAQAHLVGLKIFMADEIGQIASSEAAAKRHHDRSENESAAIRAIIDEGFAQRRMKEAQSNGQTKERSGEPKQATSQEGLLGKSTIDNFVQKVVKGNVRLIEKDGIVVPRVLTGKDASVIAAPNYDRTQARLGRIKAAQDELIEGLRAALQRNPGMLTAKTGNDLSADASLTDRYRLATSNKRHQQAFRWFADEPDVRKVILDAAARNEQRAKKVDLAAKAETPGSTSSTDVDSNRGQTNKPSHSQSDDRASQIQPDKKGDRGTNPQIAEKVIAATREHFLRPVAVRRGEQMEITFSDQEAALHKLPRRVVLEDARSVGRMEGILKRHDRSVKRLAAYLEKNPAAARPASENAPATLIPSAPKELRDIAQNYSQDRQVRRAFENAIVRARLDKVDPRKQSSVEEERTDVSAKSGERKIETPASTLKAANDTRVDDENRVGGQGSQIAAKAQENDRSDQVAPTGQEETTQRKPETSEPKQQNLFRLGPGGTIVRSIPESEKKTYGARKVAGVDEAAQAPAVNGSESGEDKRRAVLGEIDPDLIGKQTFERRAARKLEKGIHPKVDAWIEASERKDRDAREKAAAAIRDDRKLLSLFDEMDPQVRARLQRDWDGIDDRRKRNGGSSDEREQSR